MKREGKARIVVCVRTHHDVICSPLRQDTILLPARVRQLHPDLLKSEIGLPDVVVRETTDQ